MKQRLDKLLLERGMVASRSQAESWIRLGRVKVDGLQVVKAGAMVGYTAKIVLDAPDRYVSRAGLKLSSVAGVLGLDFRGKVVLDVGSSTGGFTDYALQNGASKVFAVDVGTDQLHPSLRGDERIELHEKTDIRDVYSPVAHTRPGLDIVTMPMVPDIVVMDVSFISTRDILPHVTENIIDTHSRVAVMLKPQFEAGKQQVNRGVIKNESIRRKILADFEAWSKRYFVIEAKRDSEVSGSKGNTERFYLLKKLAHI